MVEVQEPTSKWVVTLSRACVVGFLERERGEGDKGSDEWDGKGQG